MRKRYEPNEIISKGIYSEIIIYNKDKSERCRAVIDTEDIPKINNTVWSLASGGYIRTKYKNSGKSTCLHRVIMGIENKGLEILVDHINMNKLDNRKCNLRVVNKSQNSMNRTTPSNNTYSFRGISYDKRRNKFRAYIKINGKQISLGYYNSFGNAKKARLKGEYKYFKEYSNKTELAIPLIEEFKSLNLI